MMHDRLAVGFRNLRVQLLKLLTTDARARADAVVAHRNEMQMTRNRWILLSCFGIYLTAARLHIAAYCALSIYVCTTYLIGRSVSRTQSFNESRRRIALVLDIGMISYIIGVEPRRGIIVFPLYLWVIVGNGFRFGIGALFEAIALTGAALAATLFHTSSWVDQPFLSWTLLLTVCVPPTYTSVLIWRLNQDREAAERANSAKSRFLATVSHELRTPLNAILGSVALIERHRVAEDERENLLAIELGARTLLDQIGGILDFSRIEQEVLSISSEAFCLSSLIAEVRDLMLVRARAKGVSLRSFISSDVASYIRTDRRHLFNITLNLVSNALKFTNAGFVLITVHLEKNRAEGDHLRFEVVDTGIGIAPEAHEHIFDSFSQADRSIMDQYGGTGLGLAICKRLTAALGGEIGVRSRPGTGSTFWFTITYEAVPDADEPPDLSRLEVAVLAGSATLAKGVRDVVSTLGAKATIYEDGASLAADVGLADNDRLDNQVLILHVQDPEAELEPQVEQLHRLDPNDRLRRILIVPEGFTARPPERQFDTTISHVSRTTLQRALDLVTGGHRGVADAAPLFEVPAGTLPHPLTVLIADDNPTNRRVLEKTLTRSGCVVQSVSDGKEALEAMGRGSFDVVLMDINMPIMNGLEAVSSYRSAIRSGTGPTIIAVTADATVETRAACLASGMDGCLTKPIVPSELLRHIVSISRKTEATRIKKQPASLGLPIDAQVVDELLELLGPEQVLTVVEAFMADALSWLTSLDAAIDRKDVSAIRECLHGIRSIATSVGAAQVTAAARLDPDLAADAIVEMATHAQPALKREVAAFWTIMTRKIEAVEGVSITTS